jgi:hypothetical protein
MVVHSIWFSVLMFCFSVNVAVCDAVRFEFFCVYGSVDRLYTGSLLDECAVIFVCVYLRVIFV